jgi:hypothetical protein
MGKTTIVQQLQEDAKIWERLLAATGGKLELSKCFYYILTWEFKDEGTPRHTSKQELEEQGVQITNTEADKDQPTVIKHLDCNTAHQTLGVYKTLTGDTKTNKQQE